MKLHHIGIVVKDANLVLNELSKFSITDEYFKCYHVDSQKVNVHFLNIGEVYIELVEPNEENSPVSHYSNRGGGFHHLCFEVESVKEKYRELVSLGAKGVVKPTPGFEDRMTAFVYLPLLHMNCNLIELAEPSS